MLHVRLECCGRRFRNVLWLNRHVRQHFSGRSQCCLCQRLFFSSRSRRLHRILSLCRPIQHQLRFEKASLRQSSPEQDSSCSSIVLSEDEETEMAEDSIDARRLVREHARELASEGGCPLCPRRADSSASAFLEHFYSLNGCAVGRLAAEERPCGGCGATPRSPGEWARHLNLSSAGESCRRSGGIAEAATECVGCPASFASEAKARRHRRSRLGCLLVLRRLIRFHQQPSKVVSSCPFPTLKRTMYAPSGLRRTSLLRQLRVPRFHVHDDTACGTKEVRQRAKSRRQWRG